MLFDKYGEERLLSNVFQYLLKYDDGGDGGVMWLVRAGLRPGSGASVRSESQ